MPMDTGTRGTTAVEGSGGAGTAVARAETVAPAAVAAGELEPVMDLRQLMEQHRQLEEVVKSIMKPGVHFGRIPGTDGHTLYQHGADVLNRFFGLQPEHEVVHEVRERDFISYTVRCRLINRRTGAVVGDGMGSANSREEKYAWRTEWLNQEPPKEWFRIHDPALLPPGCSVRKSKGKWTMVRKIPVEPWDYDNTLLKMAAKRAKMQATLNATGAGAIFGELDYVEASGHGEPPRQAPPPRRQSPQNGGQRQGPPPQQSQQPAGPAPEPENPSQVYSDLKEALVVCTTLDALEGVWAEIGPPERAAMNPAENKALWERYQEAKRNLS